MLRVIGGPLALFLIPFGLYAAYLLVQLVNPFEIGQWTRRVIVPLAALGIVLAVGGLIVYGTLAGRHSGGYSPAHIENGRIVPGEMR